MRNKWNEYEKIEKERKNKELWYLPVNMLPIDKWKCLCKNLINVIDFNQCIIFILKSISIEA